MKERRGKEGDGRRGEGKRGERRRKITSKMVNTTIKYIRHIIYS